MPYEPRINTPESIAGSPEKSPKPEYGDPADASSEPLADKDPDAVPIAMFNDPPLVDALGLNQHDMYDQDINEVKQKADFIDKIIKEEILRKDWKPIMKSYNDMLEKYYTKLGLKNETGFGKLQKLYLYFYLNLPAGNYAK